MCSTRNLELVRSLGAAHVVDYTKENFTRSGVRYDLIVDIASTHSLSDYRRALTPTGTLVSLGASGGPGEQAGTIRIMYDATVQAVRSLLSRQTLRLYVARFTPEDLVVLRDLAEAGRITPVIDRSYPLAEVPEAIRYLEGKGMGALLNAEKRATEYACVASQRPNFTVRFPRVDAQHVGQFIYLWEMATAYAGLMLNIDAYDQPAVELGKQATFGLMGRAGYEKFRTAVDAALTRTPWVIEG